MDKKQQTVESYDNNAKCFANKFDALGARIDDINETFALVKKEKPKVLELGCGNGRDAEEIIKRAGDYLGIDISAQLILLARQKVPKGRFEVSDVEDFYLPTGLDIIFAFASLIHVPRESLQDVFRGVFNSLCSGGVFRLSLKYSDEYKEVTKEDEFGLRTYYLYSKSDIEKMAQNFSIIKNELVDLRGQKWLEVLVQKPD